MRKNTFIFIGILAAFFGAHLSSRPGGHHGVQLTGALVFAQEAPVVSSAEAQPSTARSPLVPVNSLRDSLSRIIIFLTGRHFETSAEVDSIIGSPWVLAPDTAAQVATLQPRVRFRLYSFLSQNLLAPGVYHANLLDSSNRGSAVDVPQSMGVFELNGTQSSDFTGGLLDTASGHFSTEQLLDLGALALTKLPWFPRTERGWQNLKQSLIKHDLLLAAGFVLTQAVLNSGVIRLTGTIATVNDGQLRIGWYFDIRRLGYLFNPRLAAGIGLNSRALEGTFGAAVNINALNSEEVAALELALRNQWTQIFGSGPRGWNLSGGLRGRMNLAHNDYRSENLFSLQGELYARRPLDFNQDRGSLALGFILGSDFNHSVQGVFSTGLELGHLGLEASAQISAGYRDDLGRPEYRFGLFGGGTLTSRADRERRQVWFLASEIRRMLGSLTMRQRIETAIGENLKDYGTGKYTRGQEYEFLRQWRQAIEQEVTFRASLAEHLQRYADAWQHYCEETDQGPPRTVASCSAQEGPLEQEVLLLARQQVQASPGLH